jgi:hypothetical protein
VRMKGRYDLLSAILGVALLTLARPIEALGQKPGASKQARQKAGARSSPSGDWLLWGGSGRDFVAPDIKLPSSWPAGGPRKLWSRDLGDGLSGIAVEGTTLTPHTGATFKRSSRRSMRGRARPCGSTLMTPRLRTLPEELGMGRMRCRK